MDNQKTAEQDDRLHSSASNQPDSSQRKRPMPTELVKLLATSSPESRTDWLENDQVSSSTKRPKTTSHSTDKAGSSKEKEFPTKESSHSRHYGKKWILGSLDDLEICLPWLQAVAVMEEKRKNLYKGRFYSGCDDEHIEISKNDLHTKIQHLFSSNPAFLTRISIFTRLFLFLPRMLSPNFTKFKVFVNVPTIFLYISELCSKPSPNLQEDIKTMFRYIQNDDFTDEEKLRMVILLIPCVELSNFMMIRKETNLGAPKEIMKANDQLRFACFSSSSQCVNLLVEKGIIGTFLASQPLIASYLVEFHYYLASFGPTSFSLLPVALDKLVTNVQGLPVSNIKKNVATLVMTLMMAVYDDVFTFSKKLWCDDHIVQFYRIKADFKIAEDELLTVSKLRQLCESELVAET